MWQAHFIFSFEHAAFPNLVLSIWDVNESMWSCSCTCHVSLGTYPCCVLPPNICEIDLFHSFCLCISSFIYIRYTTRALRSPLSCVSCIIDANKSPLSPLNVLLFPFHSLCVSLSHSLHLHHHIAWTCEQWLHFCKPSSCVWVRSDSFDPMIPCMTSHAEKNANVISLCSPLPVSAGIWPEMRQMSRWLVGSPTYPGGDWLLMSCHSKLSVSLTQQHHAARLLRHPEQFAEAKLILYPVGVFACV